MKKLFSLLLLIITLNMSGQVIIHNQPVKLKNVSSYSVTDSLMTIDADGLMKYRPVSTLPVATETDPIFVAEESDILKTNEAKGVTSQITFSSTGIPLINALTSEIDAAGILSVPNSRWVQDYSEPILGNPATDGYILSSTAAGVRSWVADAGVTNLNDHFSITANYTTLLADADRKGIITGGDITLDDAVGITAEYQLNILNSKGADVTFTLGAGQSTKQYGTGAIPNLVDDQYAYLELIADNVWSVVIGGTAGGGSGTIGGTIADNQIAIGNGADAIDGSSSLIYDGIKMSIGGITDASPGNYDTKLEILGNGTIAAGRTHFRLKNTSADSGAIFDILNNTNQGLQVLATGQSYAIGQLTRFGGFDSDLLFAAGVDVASGSTKILEFSTGGYNAVPQMSLNGGRLKLTEDPLVSADVGNMGFNDTRYLNDLIDDTTPQLGGNLDLNLNKIIGANNGLFDIIANGNGSKFRFEIYDATPASNDFWLSVVDNGTNSTFEFRFDTVDNTTQMGWNLVNDSVDDLGAFELYKMDILDGNDATLKDFRLNITTEAATATLLTGNMNSTIYSTSATAITLTIPDTLTEEAGSHITFVQEAAGALTIAVSGTATLNGVAAGSITLSGQYKGVQLIQRVASSDDWIAIGSF